MTAAEISTGRATSARRTWDVADTAWFEAGSAFAILLPLLFAPQLTTVGVALSFGFTGVYGWAHRRTAIGALTRGWPLLLIPVVALASTIWSDYPGVTLKHALELWVTVGGGLLLSASRRPTAILVGAALAFGLFLAASLVLGGSVGVGMGDVGTAFSGLNGRKNLLGMTAALGALISVFVFATSLRKRALFGLALAAALFVLEAWLGYVARSAGAIIGFGLAVIAFLVVACLGLVPPRRRAAACGMLVLLLTAGALTGYAFANNVSATVLQVFGKDATLTGRSYLWYRAGDFIQERPLLGHGYEAFWVQGNLDAEGLWQYGGITERTGFSFHNTLIELLVHFGWIGTVLISGVFVYACLRLLRRISAEPSLAGAFFVALVVFQIARMPFESLIPSPVDFSTLLTIAALGYGFAPFAAPPEVRQATVLMPRRVSIPQRAPWATRRFNSGK